jgi:hypothetical protein
VTEGRCLTALVGCWKNENGPLVVEVEAAEVEVVLEVVGTEEVHAEALSAGELEMKRVLVLQH